MKPVLVPRRSAPIRVPTRRNRLLRLCGVLVAVGIAVAAPLAAWAAGPNAGKATRPAASCPAGRKPCLDHSGARQVGIASFYARYFAGRRMANGKPMRPESDNAASRVLPLGTKARVTNLVNGRTSIVTIADRGPYVNGRIIDLSPATARKLGITGLARVEVAPIAVPQPDGSVKTDVALAEPESAPGRSWWR